MSEDHPTISSSRLNATEVARHTFGTVRRGLDPQEVRSYLELVARELQVWEQREQELRAELAEAEERARHPVIDEATLTAALGQQSASLLRHSHHEAARITNEAEERAVAVVRQAQSDATETMVRAETAAAERIAEAELVVTQVREEAAAESRSIIQAARDTGEDLVDRARQHGRGVVEEAQAARRKVLTDLANRRKALYGQIEQLRAARDELASAVLGVRDVVDGIAQDLTNADAQVREAASDAARRAEAEGLPPTDEQLVADVETGPIDAPADWLPPDAADPPGREAGPPSVAAHGEVPTAVETSKASGGPPPATSTVVTAEVEVVHHEDGEVPAPVGTPAGEPAPASPAHLGLADGADGGEPEAQGEMESIDSRSLEELFARIRASQQPGMAVEGSEGSGGDGTTSGGDRGSLGSSEATGRGAVNAEGAADAGDATFLERRDQLLGPIVIQLARRLKRALADDQNQLLDRLRSTNGAWSDDVLVAEEDHAAEIAAAVLEPLREAAEAGRTLVAAVAENPGVTVPMEGLAEELGLTVVRRLRRRLPGGEDGPSVADVDDASEIVGAAYRTWRGQRVETLAGDFAVAATGDAIVAVTGAAVPLQWVVGSDHPPCADCEDNSLTDPVAAGDQYPTGHARPPAHPGCRCGVVPAITASQ